MWHNRYRELNAGHGFRDQPVCPHRAFAPSLRGHFNVVQYIVMSFEKRYQKLNARQKEAVDSIDGPLMVIAGPGTGKTELLSMRTANILQQTDTLPENILCLTFTESGANAMRARLEEIIGPEAYKVAIHTFHSFGTEIINQYGEYFYQGANFRPADELSTYQLLEGIFDELDYSNPLATKMNGQYTHIADVMTVISELKKSGLTNEELNSVLDANERALDGIEKDISKLFASRISQKTADELAPLAHKVASVKQPLLPPGIPPLSSVLALSIAHAVDEAHDTNSTKPITAWKNKYLEKNEAGLLVFKDRKRTAKLRALSFVYYQYLVRMQEARLFDFDDMVLRVVHAMEVFPELRYNLQEKYLYIMVDEFQDTNLAQARMLYNLTTYETGDAPNIMVVGDDDQAIYSFQGAEVGNILSFRDRFEGAKLITLEDNYRSTAPILEASRQVISQGIERLERLVTGIDKTLKANHTHKNSQVELVEYARVDDERAELVGRIKQQIDSGVDPSTITVLARRHHELVNLLPHFSHANISVNYERRDNVLDSEVIGQLELVAQIVLFIAGGQLDKADALLPQLLAHPAWGVPTELLWELALAAHKNHSGWLEEMALQPAYKPLHGWLVEQARICSLQPVEYSLDALLGTPDTATSGKYHSPLYEYFFAEDKRAMEPGSYITYLEALRTIRAKLREYRPNSRLTLADFIEFIALHRQLSATITSVRSRVEASQGAVNLMTAHKAKGLEFDHVYIHGAIDTSWGERVRTRSRSISYPENLPLAPAGDTLDERLRLFFVAMTRARDSLTISYSLQNDSDKQTTRASFLLGDTWHTHQIAASASQQQLEAQLAREWYQPVVALPRTTMQQLLAPTLQTYKLSATHLNNFLDVTRGGPHYFLLNNLLRFPGSMSPSAAFGSAIHSSLQRAHAHLAAHGTKKPTEDVLHDFETALSEKWLAEADHEQFSRRGTDALQAFLAEHYDSFTASEKAELSFSGQQVTVQNARLTGVLDVATIDKTNKTMYVIDYKTGKPAASWQGKTDYEKIKLHKYKQQLMFYKLLVENSRDWHEYTVEKGSIQFVEPTPGSTIRQLDLEFSAGEMAAFSQLVAAVFQRIIQLDLPDTSSYAQNYAGMLEFEASLLT